MSYVSELNCGDPHEFKFSKSQNNPDLYSSIYALMIYGLFNELDKLSDTSTRNWANYILSFQQADGLFKDPYLKSKLSETGHHWGWYHLLPHVLIALDYLGVRPKHDFQWVYEKFENQTPAQWMRSRDWEQDYLSVSNEVMNVLVALQYSRDKFENKKSYELIDQIKSGLFEYVHKDFSLWGYPSGTVSLKNLSKAVKTTYHILPMYYYDDELNLVNVDNLLRKVLATQHDLGGYSFRINSDACEDIDSSYLLSILKTNDKTLETDVKNSLFKYLNWVSKNMNRDGGFVFNRLKSFQYGDQKKLFSAREESNMFATWFRTLAIAFAFHKLGYPNDFRFSSVSGYQYLRGE